MSGAVAQEADVPAVTAPDADVVFLGEIHDNPDHHAFQAEVVAALNPAALVFEMLTPDQAAAITPALRSDPAALAAAVGWAEAGWPDFSMYAPIFAAGESAAIYGAGVPREAARAAFGGDLADVFGAEAARYGLTEPLPEAEQSAREAEQLASHCDALPEAMLPGMVAAQRLRDARLAGAALAALQAEGGPVVVVTGNGHARTDRGAPAVLARADPGVAVLSLGQLEAAAEAPPYDRWRVTEPVPREDPCAAFE